uniref:Uncharacterized protein n=1 Tax=Cacopsylla melanoneura TaxID=428564 RepID=A0A8D8T1B9_9HEMI
MLHSIFHYSWVQKRTENLTKQQRPRSKAYKMAASGLCGFPRVGEVVCSIFSCHVSFVWFPKLCCFFNQDGISRIYCTQAIKLWYLWENHSSTQPLAKVTFVFLTTRGTGKHSLFNTASTAHSHSAHNAYSSTNVCSFPTRV